jgi:hypothetical protein
VLIKPLRDDHDPPAVKTVDSGQWSYAGPGIPVGARGEHWHDLAAVAVAKGERRDG